MAAVTELATAVGTRVACRALFAPRTSHYRKRRASIFPTMTQVAAFTARALGPAEREKVLAYLHGERFQDRSPAAVYATLLDEPGFFAGIFRWYNEEHRHSGLGLLTPAMVHYNQTALMSEPVKIGPEPPKQTESVSTGSAA